MTPKAPSTVKTGRGGLRSAVSEQSPFDDGGGGSSSSDDDRAVATAGDWGM
jgi:hypothetical protein